MLTLSYYINEYGKYTFDEKPFNEIDNLIFSQLIYIDFAGIVPESPHQVEFSYVSKRYSELHSDDDINSLVKISQKAVFLMKECAATKRFGDIRLCNYVNNVVDDIDKQFAAINFILNDGSLLVAFRGTDITVTGIKESAMLSCTFPIPAQIQALYYFQETAMAHNGMVRACGHSKGGNLAVFAAVSCSNSLKKKIVGVYENDAPGFPRWFFDREDFKQISDRIIFLAPEGSIIGRMLYHQEKPIIVKSSNNTGLKQHQVSSWNINIDFSLDTVDKFDENSDYTTEFLNKLIEYIGEDDLAVFFDTLEYVIENSGVDDLNDFKTFEIRRLFSMIDSLKNIQDEQKVKFKQVIKLTMTDFAKSYLSSKSKDFMEEIRDLKIKKIPYSEE